MSEPSGPNDKPTHAPAAPLRATPRDLDVYAALVGVPPETLLIPTRPTARDAAGSATARAWESVTHAVGGLTVRLGRGNPEFSAWVRRVSGHARRQIRHARRRLSPAPDKTPTTPGPDGHP